jgi:hypothetical protein
VELIMGTMADKIDFDSAFGKSMEEYRTKKR